MQFKHLYAVIALAVGCTLMSCHSKIDLENVDARAEVEVGLALPVGTIKAKISDFLGSVKNIYIDSVDNKGVITWKDTFAIERNYHDLKLESYVPGAHIHLNVTEKLAGNPLIVDGKITTLANDVTVPLDFPLTIKLDGLNHPDSTMKARLDSALIENASFSSTINAYGGLPLEWEWIDSVILNLGERVHRPKGSDFVVYKKGDPEFSYCNDYNIPLSTNVDNFSLVLMKNIKARLKEDYVNNVVDSVTFNIHFVFTIPKNKSLAINPDAGFDYQLKVHFLTYKAVWGMFKPSNAMRDENITDISESWGDMGFLSKASLPFSKPKVEVLIGTQIAGAMRIDSAYIFAVDQNNNRTYAQFGDNYKEVVTKDLDNWLPLKSEIGDSTEMSVTFDNTPDGGRISRLFKGIPSKMGYRFNVKFYDNKTPQIRITPNTSVKVKAIASLPMMFDKGLFITYSDTIKEVHLSQFSIDSIVATTPILDSIKATDVALYLKAMNEIPMDVKATMRCYDENDQLVMDPRDPSQPFLLFPEDTIKFVAPTFNWNGTEWKMASPGQTTIVARLSIQQLNVFPKISYITYTTIIDDESLQSAFANGTFNIKLTGDAQLAIKIGLTAQLDAILNLAGDDKNKNNK